MLFQNQKILRENGNNLKLNLSNSYIELLRKGKEIENTIEFKILSRQSKATAAKTLDSSQIIAGKHTRSP